MTLIRRHILAFALLAGIAPAFAQAPAPVPALPDTERRTSYSISASTCACAVGFQLYGDGTDYANWVEVFVNGVPISASGGWTITSPSGALATLARPITDAVLTFTVAQTGTVQIVGARRPRRTSQFLENRGVAARDLNQVLSDIIAQNREIWDKTNDVTGRAVMAPPGETLALLPVLASRANTGACFNSSGNLVSCVTIPAGTIAAGSGIVFTGTNPTTLSVNGSGNTTKFASVSGALSQGHCTSIDASGNLVDSGGPCASLAFYNPVTAPPYNAKCDGATDDTAAIQAAINATTYGSRIDIPAECRFDSTLDFKGHHYVSVYGSARMGSTTPAPALTFGGTGTRAIDARDVRGLKFFGVNLQWRNASFTGILLDAGSATPGSNVSFYQHVEEGTIQPIAAGNITSVTCINVSESIEFVISRMSFAGCGVGIHGQNLLGQSTVGLIEHNQFFQTAVSPISECGESWTIINNTFENLQNGKAGAFGNTPSLACRNIAFIGNWFGDVNSAGGTWITVASFGFLFQGNRMSSISTVSDVGINLAAVKGFSISGNSFEQMSLAISMTLTPDGGFVCGNTYHNVTAFLSSGGGANILSATCNASY